MSARIKLGNLTIGGGAPIRVQSMTNTDTRDAEATLAQIGRLAALGCEAVRVAVPDDKAAKFLPRLVEAAPVPLIADIHFDWRLAIAAIESGMAGIRINPGNIGGREKTERIIDAAKSSATVIRIGVNSGSLEKDLLAKYGRPSGEAMAESALRHVRVMEDRGFDNIKISLKSSSVGESVVACRKMAAWRDYPLHLGVTEAGTFARGAIKSAIGLGVLLHEGIGDTIRVSLTAEPEEEIFVAYEILRALGLRERGPEIISCPTCGRTEIDLRGMAEKIEQTIAGWEEPLKIAVMGCVVNGPGEAREADIGIAGGRGKGVIFRKGKIVASIEGEDAALTAFLAELDKAREERAREMKASKSGAEDF